MPIKVLFDDCEDYAENLEMLEAEVAAILDSKND